MRVGLLLLLAVTLGAALGWGVAEVRLHWPPWQGYVTGGPNDPNAVLPPVGAPTARAGVAQTTFDFGTMDVKAEGQHRFDFRNDGQADLLLTAGPTSCGCTGLETPKSPILPGQSGFVVVRWRSKDGIGRYEQNATVITNDPEHPRVKLTVTGKITGPLQAEPAEVTFSHLSVNESATVEVRVYAYRASSLRLESPRFGDPATANKFVVSQDPLTAEQLRQAPDAKCGVSLRITAKSGLPLGPIRQTITLPTNLPEHPSLELSIQGVVTSDIAVYGLGWSEERQTLHFGAVGRHGIERSLTIIARGSQHKEVQFKLSRVQPPLLEAVLGPTIIAGAVSRTELKIRIPPGSRTGGFLGPAPEAMGQILIETTHPLAPQIRLYVSFSVDES